ncbi:hypothetical protein Scuro_33 [Acinetobacter phage Scuro]|nr:hypothetical protein Scuro_33 [Acinetobacter phage Scuro]
MFKLEECATAIAVAMVGTIRSGDDAVRFSQHAKAEGFKNISELIANDAVKQALALQARLAKVDPKYLSTTIPSVTHSIGEVSTTTSTIDAPTEPGLTDFSGNDNPAEVFANTVTDVGAETEATASTVPGPDTIDIPLPPATSAPVADNTISTSTTTAPASNVELDDEGLPWDVRIHSSSGVKIKDGTWKLKRGLDAAYVEEIKAELKQVMNIPAPDATTPPPPQSQDTNAFSVGTVNKLIEAGNGGTAIAPPPPAAEPAKITTFAQLARAITEKKIDNATVSAVLNAYGIGSMPLLAPRPDLIPGVAEALGL